MFHIAGLGLVVWNIIRLFASPRQRAKRREGGGWVGGWGEEMEDISDYGPGRKCMKKRLSWEGCKKYHVASMGQRNTLRKQPTFRDASTGLLSKGPPRNERRNSILMTYEYTDLGSASDWTCREESLPQPIRITTPDLGSDTSSVWTGVSAFVS